ncbi:MAG: hypothetical protein JSU68_02005, partial [Phycisphaerales bacterium]
MSREPVSDAGSEQTKGTQAGDPTLRRLLVIRRLTVGPVRIEPRRVVAPYAVEQAGGTDTFELIYRYEEDVFRPDDPADLNLASMIAAQVALNYGLFCEEILFRGAFDKPDRRFLGDMAENTAREIYVKKFLEPNPFLVGAAVGLPAVKLPRYCAAKLEFEGPENPEAGFPSSQRAHAPWPRGGDRYLILSS